MIFTNDMYITDNYKTVGNVLFEFLNCVFLMNNIIWRHGVRINHITLINVHFYFCMYRNKNQILDYAKDNLSLHLQKMCINNYNIANFNWIAIYDYKVWYLCIVLCVNYSQLNMYRCSMIIIIIIVFALFVVYSKIDNFKEVIFLTLCVNSYHCEIYIFCNVSGEKSNYSTDKILCHNYLSLI